ncbi:MAG: glutathione S-transferase family protein [Candidatus Pelagadaptatus aseana]|uniref:glutathione S-transferase family protein n=1 Tax=Candidatus Pelagadaptatus aseana TaxID=3120508 RepID=UPI0039B298F1
MADISLYGVILSPYVRKVRLALDFKGVAYESVPVFPIPGAEQPPEFKANSPLGKIPLLRSGETFVPDSSVICAWLEREVPQPALLPEDNALAARALWFDAYMASKMVPVIAGHLFAEVVLAKAVFQRDPIQSDIDAALNVEIPEIFDYLESELSGDYLVGDGITLADIAVGGMFLTLAHCGYEHDAGRWPNVVAYKDRIMAEPVFANALAEEQAFLAAMAG